MKIRSVSAEFHAFLQYYSIKTMKTRNASAEFHAFLFL